MYSANTIAKYVINKCHEANKSVSNLKLQNILYFIQAEFLISKGEPCFNETIEAWDFGPVVPDVYHRYKVYGGANIPTVFAGHTGYTFTESDKALIDGIIDKCAKYSAATLVDITHHQAPWKKAYCQYAGAIITNSSIQDFSKED